MIGDQWIPYQANTEKFVITDATTGANKPGLGTGFTVQIQKGLAPFALGLGTKAELGNGWYSYTAASSEADTPGKVAIYITAPGAADQNLEAWVGTVTPSNAATGTGAPSPGAELLGFAYPNRALSLAEYARLISYDEPAFWGFYYDGQTRFDCRTQWTQAQRLMVATAIAEAEELLEGVLKYPLAPRWIVDEAQPYCNTLFTKWGRVIAGGVKAVADIQAGAMIDYTTEPATVGPLATTATDAKEIRVYYPGSDIEITPALVTIAGGFVTIKIPRARMPVDYFNPTTGWDYTNLANFVATVDVKRIYNDGSTQAQLVAQRAGCADLTQAACIYIRDSGIGEIRIAPGAYTGGAWQTVAPWCSDGWHSARLNYMAGLGALDPLWQGAILRLAHSLMPEEPCGCDVTQRLWKRDREIPTVITRERLNNPFGLSNGAWYAWKIAKGRRLIRGATL